MDIEINRRTCVKSGQCSYLHPELFERDSENFPVSKIQYPTEKHRQAIEEAVELCPTGSISLVDDAA